MNQKKPYTTPQLFEVPLDQEQAILTSCSTATIATSAGGTNGCRPLLDVAITPTPVSLVANVRSFR